jgi:phosphoglycolate phosphatase
LQRSIQAILFDKDGTLLDYHLSWAPINEQAADYASQGNAALKAQLLAVGGLDAGTGRYKADSLLAASNTAEIARAWVAAGSPFEWAGLADSLDAIFRSGVTSAVPVIDLAPFFRGLKAHRLTLGIASSDGEQAIRMTLDRFGCTELVDFVAGYDSGFGSKPEPGMFNAFATLADLDPAVIAIVGDNRHDMEMGRRGGAGLRIAVLTGTSDRAQLEPHADVCVESIRELEQVLFG